jgi:ParB/RepB/Spo0J family partition protein
MREEKIKLERLHFLSNRAYGGEGEIQILAEDIKRNGLINPITVIQNDSYEEGIFHYDIVAGRRRKMAVELLGWKEIPCRILVWDEKERAEEIAGSENINRLAMHPLDEAKVFSQLLENGRPIEELAKQYDRSISAIYQRIQLLRLTENLRMVFHAGKIDLQSAAMLSSLEDGQQEAFYKKFNKQTQNNIGIWDVKKFISGVRHDKLYKCMTDKDCAKCKTRTFYTNNKLFPDLNIIEDLCLNHECYMQKWTKLLTASVKAAKAQFKTHTEAKIILCDNDGLYKIFGKTMVLDGVEFEILNIHWNNRPDKKQLTKGHLPCFMVDVNYTDFNNYDDSEDDSETTIDFVFEPRYWKEPAKEKETAGQQTQSKKESDFAPAVKILGLPKEEAVAAVKAFEDNKEKLAYYNLENKIQEKVFWKIMEERPKKGYSEADSILFITSYLQENTSLHYNKEQLKIFKLFTGADYSKKIIPELAKLPKEKLLALLFVLSIDPSDLPDTRHIDTDKDNEILKWAGVKPEELREMYKEEIKVLLPKPKAADRPVKPASKKELKKTGSGKRGMIKK